jgi:hypothetical protein
MIGSRFLISKTPWILRVDASADWGIIIKVVGETQRIKEWVAKVQGREGAL